MVTLTKGRVRCIKDDTPGKVGDVYNILKYDDSNSQLCIEWEQGWAVRGHYPEWKEHIDKIGYWVSFKKWELISRNEYGCRSNCIDCKGKCNFYEPENPPAI